LNGYVKHLAIAGWREGELGTFTNENFFHNRIKFGAYPQEAWSLGVDLRNRLFYGEGVKDDPHYGDRLMGQYPQRFEASDLLVDEPGAVLHSKLDRAWLRFSKGNWEVTAGRQRINWSMNLAWNPNDLFNAYSFVDFDYEERPGSDAVWVRYFPAMMSSIDIAYRPGEEADERVAAFRYKFNRKGYDVQIIGGQYRSDAAFGVGWAGNLGDAGLKGEATYFHPHEDYMERNGQLSASATVDRMFPNGSYMAASYLWNSEGIDEVPRRSLNLFQRTVLDAKSLMPTEHSILYQIQHRFDPTLQASLASIWSPGSNALFFMPSLTHTIDNSWDLSLHGQFTYIGTRAESGLRNLGNALFLRMRWSF
jgi:hypothetical protein